ncbi:MAG: hypothetical protein KC613_00780 [Myxococcales bacterium]|nr:hypothetical protein [Myxococcales bacterium]MCB9524295.1 hypothetical protein [Myxococcales bacterium]
MRTHLLALSAPLALVACAAATDAPVAPTSTPSQACVGKCDGVSGADAALHGVRFDDVGRCWLVPDEGDTLVRCRLDGADVAGLKTTELVSTVYAGTAEPATARHDLSAGPLGTVDLARVPADTGVTLQLWWTAEVADGRSFEVMAGVPTLQDAATTQVHHEATVRLTSDTPGAVLGLPWTAWPLAVDAAPALAATWPGAQGSYLSVVLRADGGLDTGAGQAAVSFAVPDLTDRLGALVPVSWVLQADGRPLALAMDVGWADDAGAHEVTETLTLPGRYELGVGGALTLVQAPEADLVSHRDLVGGAAPVAPAPTPDPEAEEAPACAAECAHGEVCVDGACVPLRGQVQDDFCGEASAACAVDAQCADAHACVEGLCRRLSCQTQDAFCAEPTAPCVAGADCGDGHVCVEGLCRRLSCQAQSGLCHAPTAVCALDSDCAARHGCVDGLCTRESCR